MHDDPNQSQQIRDRWLVFLHALFFVLGFTLVFTIGWGGATTLLGRLFSAYKIWISRAGGVLVILFGLSTLGWLNIPLFNMDTRPEWRGQDGDKNAWLSSFMMGIFFAAGWTPCIGTTLGAILTLGISQENSIQAILLAGVYALGLGIPFLIIGYGMEQASEFIRKYRRQLHAVQIASGVLLIFIGIMLLTDQLSLIAVWAQKNGLFVSLPAESGNAAPNVLLAFLAGMVSFLSPCVLPLVTAYISYLSKHAFSTRTQKSES